MNEIFLTIFFISLLLFLLGSGVWVALSMIAVSAIGMMLFTTRPVGDAMATTIWGTSSSWTLTALPLFVWMGEILFRTKLSENLFKGLSPWLSKLPGGLIHVNVVGCGLFAAISGSSAATVATVGKMSIPELRKRKYPEKILLGSLAGSGTLGLLIPPSIILIIYGVTIEDSIAKLFMAGIFPGIMLAIIFMLYVVVWSIINKKQMPKISEEFSFIEKVKRSKQLLPVVLLICSVIGSIYTGIATATEAASLGVVGALILSLFQGTLNKDSFKLSLLGATKTSCMIAFILAGSTFLSLAMGFTGLPRNLAIWIQELNLSPYMLIFILTIFYIILGMFLDGISAVVLTMAIIEPMIRQAGFDMIWFGIYLVIVVEMAQITPPVGFNLFVLQGMANRDMSFIAKSAFPLFLLMILAVIIIIIFPEIALWLPNQMSQNIN
ncbi:TRAP transporter large permease subunit [Candidatus Pelagibacter sp.]|jgi:tripartite ATP-independent transporter DctM subunit|nr:TRAP transporter large permease subunit [bacterium]MDA9880779.1 TRAP transporter large permease subunit [Candidatus Pelagibacter sp.]MDC1281969.1 TRAP transporter large permease subunit [Pelagibacteraceae bacterium]MDB0038601.1 TRAP transporter large permease subunit [Candidatus Pelagibacter sp.]MDC0236173.1 TRAP transporter large permease subunit [Candidatus Pelagibacter sp.]|tara:strand:+ start:2058 stop:3368 length:1311 start_codon:yes stop_codon:yes gene_type:complete